MCEIVDGEDGEGGMARRDECRRFADRWGVRMISIEMLVRERLRREGDVKTNGGGGGGGKERRRGGGKGKGKGKGKED